MPETYAGPAERPPPALTFILAGLGGFRGIAAEALWFRVNRLQEEGRFLELVQLSDWITRLDPHAADAWIYNAWNLVLDTKGLNLDETRAWPQNALLAVDRNAGTLEVTPAYYVFRHIGQYVDVGAVRVGTQGGNALAFRNPDGSIVTIIFNENQQQAQMTLSVGGQSLQFTVPGRGWATVNWQG